MAHQGMPAPRRLVDDMRGNDLTAARSVFNNYVKYGCAFPDFRRTGRSDTAGHPGPARRWRRHGGRDRRAGRHGVAGGFAPSQGADRRGPDRAQYLVAVATMRVESLRPARSGRLARGEPPLLGEPVRAAAGVLEAHGAAAVTEKEKPWP